MPLSLPPSSSSVEEVQDLVAAMIKQGTGITAAYNDATGELTISATGEGSGALDAEAVRDTIATALQGVGLVSVTPNDAGDTIVIATTATANSSDAFLLSRLNHTGQQPASTISDFVIAKSTWSVNARSANYTLVAGDAGRTIGMNASTVTVPAATLPVGCTVKIVQTGDAEVTLVPGAGVAIGSRHGLTLDGRNAVAELWHQEEGVFVLSGDLKVGVAPGYPDAPKLRWADPSLQSPITINIPATGLPVLGTDGTNFVASFVSGWSYQVQLESGKDYIINFPDTYRTQNLRIRGGRKVAVLTGGGMRCAGSGGLWITETEMLLYLEGLDIDQSANTSPTDAIQIEANCRVYAQNYRGTHVIGTPTAGQHGDIFQVVKCAGCYIDRHTGSSECQGDFLRPDGSGGSDRAYTGPIYISNADILHSQALNTNFTSSGGGDMYWFVSGGAIDTASGPTAANWYTRNAPQIHLDEVYARSTDYSTGIVYPWEGDGPVPSTYDDVAKTLTLGDGLFVDPAVDKSGFVKIGAPAGAFVKDENCGVDYVSPGYQFTETAGTDTCFSTTNQLRWKHYIDPDFANRGLFIAYETASAVAPTSVTASFDGGAPVALAQVANGLSSGGGTPRYVHWFALTGAGGVAGSVAEIIITLPTFQNCAGQSWHYANVHQTNPVRRSGGTTLGGASTASGTSLTATALGYPDSSIGSETGTLTVLVAAGVRLTQGTELTTRTSTGPVGNGIPAGKIRPDENRQMGSSSPRNNRVFFGRVNPKGDDTAVSVTLGWSGADVGTMQLLPIRKAV